MQLLIHDLFLAQLSMWAILLNLESKHPKDDCYSKYTDNKHNHVIAMYELIKYYLQEVHNVIMSSIGQYLNI